MAEEAQNCFTVVGIYYLAAEWRSGSIMWAHNPEVRGSKPRSAIICSFRFKIAMERKYVSFKSISLSIFQVYWVNLPNFLFQLPFL